MAGKLITTIDDITKSRNSFTGVVIDSSETVLQGKPCLRLLVYVDKVFPPTTSIKELSKEASRLQNMPIAFGKSQPFKENIYVYVNVLSAPLPQIAQDSIICAYSNIRSYVEKDVITVEAKVKVIGKATKLYRSDRPAEAIEAERKEAEKRQQEEENKRQELFFKNIVVPVPMRMPGYDSADEVLLRIGYTDIYVPVSAISVTEENGLDVVDLLRAAGSLKELSAKARLSVNISFTITSTDAFNRIVIPLLDQFRRTAFLPVDNAYLNDTFHIDALTLYNFSISTSADAPGTFIVQLECAPFCWFMYMHNDDTFDGAFCWPLFKMWCDRRSTCKPLDFLDGSIMFKVADKDYITKRIDAIKKQKSFIENHDEVLIDAAIELGKESRNAHLRNKTISNETRYPVSKEHDAYNNAWIRSEETFDTPHIAIAGIRDARLWKVVLQEYIRSALLNSVPSIGCSIAGAESKDAFWICGLKDLVHGTINANTLMDKLNAYIESFDSNLLTQKFSLKGCRDISLQELFDYGIVVFWQDNNDSTGILALQRAAKHPPTPQPIDPEDPTHYNSYLFSETAVISSVMYQFSTKVAVQQTEAFPLPIHQYLGRGDGVISIQGVINGIENVEMLQAMMQDIRDLAKLNHSTWQFEPFAFAKVDNDVLNAIGIDKILPVTLRIDTMPEYPDTYTFQMDAVEYKDTTRRLEQFNRMEDTFLEFLSKHNGFVDSIAVADMPDANALLQRSDDTGKKTAVKSSYSKLMLKLSDLYPDMELPSKTELSSWILSLQAYIKSSGKLSDEDKRYANKALAICDTSSAEVIDAINSMQAATTYVSEEEGGLLIGWENADFYCPPSVLASEERKRLLDTALDNKLSSIRLIDQFNAKLHLQPGEPPEKALERAAPEDRANVEKEIEELRKLTAKHYGGFIQVDPTVIDSYLAASLNEIQAAHNGLTLNIPDDQAEAIISYRDKLNAALDAQSRYGSTIIDAARVLKNINAWPTKFVDYAGRPLSSSLTVGPDGLDVALFCAIGAIESNWNPDCVTPTGIKEYGDAVGIIQLTAEELAAIPTKVKKHAESFANVKTRNRDSSEWKTRYQIFLGLYTLIQKTPFLTYVDLDQPDKVNAAKHRIDTALIHRLGFNGFKKFVNGPKNINMSSPSRSKEALRYAQVTLAISKILDERVLQYNTAIKGQSLDLTRGLEAIGGGTLIGTGIAIAAFGGPITWAILAGAAAVAGVGAGLAGAAAGKSAALGKATKEYYFGANAEEEAEQLAQGKKISTKLRTMFYDFEHREDVERLAAAFPTYFVCILDEGRWLGYERLWDHFYGQFGIASIDVIQSRKTPVDVATVTFSNMYGRLTSVTKHIQHQKEDDTRRVYTMAAILGGLDQFFGGAVDEDLKRRWNRYINSLLLEPGSRLHIRLGYLNDASKLPVKFNGVVSDVPVTADYVQVIALGDGIELTKPISPEAPKMKMGTPSEGSIYANTGFLNTPKEPQQIIGEFWEPRSDFIANPTHGRWMRSNDYNIIHFGSVDFSHYNGFTRHSLGEVGVNLYTSRICDDPEREYSSMSNWFTGISQFWDNAMGYTLFGVYQANASVWEVMETCRKAVPDYIVAVRPFEFRSTFFYGKGEWPFYYEYKNGLEDPYKLARFQADIEEGMKIDNITFDIDFQIQEMKEHGTWNKSDNITNEDLTFNGTEDYYKLMHSKAFTQAHVISTHLNLVSTAILASADGLFTNCQVKYAYGLIGTGQEASQVMHADTDIFPEYQTTKIIQSGLLAGPFHGGLGIELGIRKLTFGLFKWAGAPLAANNTAATYVRDSLADMYQGVQIIQGDPYINPWDYCYTLDMRSMLRGVYQVKEVVNSFSLEGGYLTSVTPDCVTFMIGATKLSTVGSIFQLMGLYSSAKLVRWATFMSLRVSSPVLALKLAALHGNTTYAKAAGKVVVLEKVQHILERANKNFSKYPKKIKNAQKRFVTQELNKTYIPGRDAAVSKALQTELEAIAQEEAATNVKLTKEAKLARLANAREAAIRAYNRLPDVQTELQRLRSISDLMIKQTKELVTLADSLAKESYIGRYPAAYPAILQRLDDAEQSLVKLRAEVAALPGAAAGTDVEEVLNLCDNLLKEVQKAKAAGTAVSNSPDLTVALAELLRFKNIRGVFSKLRIAAFARDFANLDLAPLFAGDTGEVLFGKALGKATTEVMVTRPAWLLRLVDLTFILISGTIGDAIGRWLSSLQCIGIMPLTINGMEFSAGINGHAGSVVGDLPGVMDDILGKIFSFDYGMRKNGVLGAILPALMGLVLPGSNMDTSPDLLKSEKDDGDQTFKAGAFAEYIDNLRAYMSNLAEHADAAAANAINSANRSNLGTFPTNRTSGLNVDYYYTSKHRDKYPLYSNNNYTAELTAQFFSLMNGQPAVQKAFASANRILSNPGMDKTFANRVRALLAKVYIENSIILSVTDGYRTYAEQARAKANKPSLAAAPGSSYHEIGYAVDLDMRDSGFAASKTGGVNRASTSEAEDIVHVAGDKIGIVFPVRREWWHAQPFETSNKVFIRR